jgi:hypothetical protein
MYCPQCGTQNPDGGTRCTYCSFVLPPAPAGVQAPAPSAPGVIETLIPYKNSSALFAYYLGVFSLLGGIILGAPAVVLGVLGLRYAKLHPEARGKAHAWTGIILGGLMSMISVAVVVFLFVLAAKGR